MKTRRRLHRAARRYAALRSTRSILVDDRLLVLDHLAATVVAVLGDVMAAVDLARRRVGGELHLVQSVVWTAHAAAGRGFTAFCNGHDGSPENNSMAGCSAFRVEPRTNPSRHPPQPSLNPCRGSNRPLDSRAEGPRNRHDKLPGESNDYLLCDSSNLRRSANGCVTASPGSAACGWSPGVFHSPCGISLPGFTGTSGKANNNSSSITLRGESAPPSSNSGSQSPGNASASCSFASNPSLVSTVAGYTNDS